MDSVSEAAAGMAFGRFRVMPKRRELLADGQPVKLGGRAFDVLLALIEARGAVVSKDTLMTQVWPDRVVEENNLQAHIVALRKAFEAERDLIRTVSGRGYQFTGEIRLLPATPDAATPDAATPDELSVAGVVIREPQPATNLPQPISALIGRDDELTEILDLSISHRLVTLTGAGGIGKTRLGFEAARHLQSRLADGVWAIQFAPLTDPALVPVTVATALGLELASGMASPLSVATALRSKQAMLVLDNCEHVVDAAAQMAEALLQANPGIRVIATSREPLRVDGEWVYPVPPLTVPMADVEATDDPSQYGAVRLFAERAQAAEPHFALDRRNALTIAEICRRLDGIPLAIELAAARAATLGIEALAAGLDDRFRLLAGGRRTALPRHQTLRATLDWSYDLLTESERVVLRRLAIFAGGFSLQAASAVAAVDKIAPSEVVDCIANLIAKSLVTADSGGVRVRYRLLETTRAYALEKLVRAGELDAAARRHAARYLDLFKSAEAEATTRPTDQWLANYLPRMDNLRAALDWAFSPDGDASIAVSLTAAAVSLWMQLSLMEECRGRVERALSAIAAGAACDRRCEMQLQAALAVSLMYTRGAIPEILAAGTRALAIGESLCDAEYQLRSLWGLWSFYTGSGQHHDALTVAFKFHALAGTRSDPSDCLIGDRIIGTSQYYLGDLLSARRHLERVLACYVAPAQKWQIFRFEVDQWAAAQVSLARILWLQGYPEQAMRAALRSVADARATNHAMSLGQALALAACPIALFMGDLDGAEHYVEMLIDHSTRHMLARWRAWGLCHQGVLAVRHGDFNSGLHLLRAGFDHPGAPGTVPEFFTFLMADALGRAGQIAEAVATIEEAIGRSERSGECCAIAEMLRIKGELFLLQGARGAAAAAEGYFHQALDWARRQGALSWELRAATSLTALWRDEGRSADAIALLQPVYDRFTEGFDTADLKAAKALLDASADLVPARG